MKPSTYTWIAIGVSAADSILAIGDTVKDLGLPGWATHSWPFVLIVASIIHKTGSILNQRAVTSNADAIASVAAQTGSTLPETPPKP